MTSSSALTEANRYFNAGQYAEAEHACNEALAQNPHDIEALRLLGICSFQIG